MERTERRPGARARRWARLVVPVAVAVGLVATPLAAGARPVEGTDDWQWIETGHILDEQLGDSGELVELEGDWGCVDVTFDGDFGFTPNWENCPAPSFSDFEISWAAVLTICGEGIPGFCTVADSGSWPDFSGICCTSPLLLWPDDPEPGTYEVTLYILEAGDGIVSWSTDGLLTTEVDEEPVTYTARFGAQQCATLGVIAGAAGLDGVEDVVRAGIGILEALVAADAVPTVPPPANDGPCEVAVDWPAGDAAGIAATADAWGVDGDQLHHLGGGIVLAIVYVLAATGGGGVAL